VRQLHLNPTVQNYDTELIEQHTPMHETTVLNSHRCLINTSVEKNEQHLNKDENFGHQMTLSESKCCIQTTAYIF
jgi:hypothetical protein